MVEISSGYRKTERLVTFKFKQKNMVTLYLILLGFVCLECVEAGLVKSCQNCTNVHVDEVSMFENITGLYIAVGEDFSVLCDVNDPSLLSKPFQFANSSANFYKKNDVDRMPLRLSFTDLYEEECVNRIYVQQGLRLMPTIRSLKLSHSVVQLYNFSFSNFRGLRRLFLSNNYIRSIPFHAFSNLSKLEVLDLSFNSLTAIDPSYLLSSLSFSTSSERIFYLSLASNSAKNIQCSIFNRDEPAATSNNNFYNISTEIDLSDNDISYIHSNCKEVITKHFRNVTLKINGNPVVCNCSSNSDGVIVDLHDCICQDEKNQSMFDFFMQLTFISSDFLLYSCLSLSGIIFMIIGVVFAHLQFKKSSRFQPSSLCNGSYCTISIKSLHNLCKDSQEKETVRRYYVYIVASQKDADILDMFVEELETQRNIPVVYKERDEIPGYFKIELFRKWLSISKRTIFLMSSNFFEDTDCANILTQAKAVEHTQRRVIVIIIKISENIRPDVMQSLRKLFIHSFYLEYDAKSTETREFWDRLERIIHDSEMHVHVTDF